MKIQKSSSYIFIWLIFISILLISNIIYLPIIFSFISLVVLLIFKKYKYTIIITILLLILLFNSIYHNYFINLNYHLYKIKIIEYFPNYCVAVYGIFKHKILIENHGYHVNDILYIYAKLSLIKYNFHFNIFSFYNYFFANNVLYKLNCLNIFGKYHQDNHFSWITNYFLYHIKIDNNNVKLLQLTNIVALFILSTIHANWIKLILIKFKINKILVLVIVLIIFGFYSYENNFYLITFKSFILELLIFTNYIFINKYKKIFYLKNFNIISSILVILFFGPYTILNIGFWFSIILSKSIYAYSNNITTKNKIISYFFMQWIIYVISQFILGLFVTKILIFNWVWIILFYPVWIFISILLILINLFHIPYIDNYLGHLINQILLLIKNWNIPIKISFWVEMSFLVINSFLYLKCCKYIYI